MFNVSRYLYLYTPLRRKKTTKKRQENHKHMHKGKHQLQPLDDIRF